MKFRLKFSVPNEVTNPEQDGRQWEYPFVLVNIAFIDLPEEAAKTEEHRVIVPISRTRLAGWSLSDSDLVKVLFEYGKRHVVACVVADELPASEFTVRFPEITNDSYPETPCEFDPSRIPWPDGFEIIVERR